jgi:hypothetical protein
LTMGMAFLMVVIVFPSLFFGVWLGSRPVVLGGTAACSALLAQRWWTRRRSLRPSVEWLHGLIVLPVVAIVSLLAAEAISVPPTDWDGVMTWLPLTRLILNEEAARPSALLDASAWFANPRYPSGVPVANATLAPLLGSDMSDERNLRIISVMFLIGYLGVVYQLADTIGGRIAARVAVGLSLTTQMLVTERKGGTMGNYADLPLAAFLGLIVLLSLTRHRPWVLSVAAVAAALTKTEGIPIVLLMLGGLVFAAWLTDAGLRARIPPLVLGVIGACGGLAVWRAPIPVRDMQEYPLKEFMNVGAVVAHLRSAMPLVLERLVPNRRWGLLWVLTAIAIVVMLWDRRRRGTGLVLLAGASAPMLVGIFAYAIHWDPARLVPVTFDRFMLQGSASAIAVAGAVVGASLSWLIGPTGERTV